MPTETPIAPAAPEAPVRSGADSLKAAIHAFGERMASGEIRLGDDTAGPLQPLQPQPPPAPADGAQGDDGAATDDGAAPSASGAVQGADGRWRNPDGSFARDPNAPEPEVGTDAPDTGTEAEGDPDVVPFVLKGLEDRGETDEEIDVPAHLEERFRRLTNDANRYREVSKRMDVIEAKEADFRTLEARMRSAPDAFVLSRLSPDVQQRLAVQLVAQHWDAIVKDLVRFDSDPSSRQLAAKDNEIRQVTAQQEWQRQAIEVRAETQALRLIEDMIPDGTTDTRANRFRTLAETELKNYYQGHNRTIPNPEQMKTLLADVARDMGFSDPTRATDGTADETQQTRTTAAAPKPKLVPGTARAPKMTAAEREAAAKRSRVVARRVAPAGAGGVPTTAPTIPQTSAQKGTNPIKDRIAFLRANPGILRATSE